MFIQRLAIIGVGLIGGSLARALRRAGACARIVGCAASPAELERALELGIIDEFHMDAATAARGAEVVIVAVPLGACAAVLSRLRSALDEVAVVSDVGSAKRRVIEDVRRILGPHIPRFVPGHPVAGAEKSGVEASSADLFRGHGVILTPVAETEPSAVRCITEIWQQAGAIVEIMDPARHDEVLAATSHLPHVLAYALVQTLAQIEGSGAVLRFAAGGFADFTRIASSSPRMWHDIVMANPEPILAMVRRFEGQLGVLAEAIRTGDSATVMRVFAQAKLARDEFGANQGKAIAGIPPERTTDG